MKASVEQITTERFQLDQFLGCFPDAPVGYIKKTTHPDFVISTGERVIGIELTQLYKITENSDHQPRAIEAFRERIVRLAKDIYISGNNISLDVGVLFSGKALTDAQVTARNLVTVIKKLASGSEAWRVATHDEINMPEEFSIIRIIKRPSHDGCLWTVSQSGWLPDLNESAVQTTISKKNEKIREYRKCVDEIWLLLVMDQIYLSSSFNVPDSTIAHKYNSA